MKNLFNKTVFAIVILLCTFILGISPCMIISTFIVIITDATFQDCIISVPFILFSVVGIIISSICINEEITNQ